MLGVGYLSKRVVFRSSFPFPFQSHRCTSFTWDLPFSSLILSLESMIMILSILNDFLLFNKCQLNFLDLRPQGSWQCGPKWTSQTNLLWALLLWGCSPAHLTYLWFLPPAENHMILIFKKMSHLFLNWWLMHSYANYSIQCDVLIQIQCHNGIRVINFSVISNLHPLWQER